MPAPALAHEFLELVRKSGVVEAARLDAYTDTADTAQPAARVADEMIRHNLISKFQATQLLRGKWKRFFIGKYKILDHLGRGGMANVFLCEHTVMRRRVAVKVLPTNKSRDGAALDRFYREARAIAALDHPNLVRAYDIDQDGDTHFLVLEYVDGRTLQELVQRNGPLDPPGAARMLSGAATGLQHAHEMGLVHRDIKPANVLLDRAGTVKLLDLGLAKFFQPEADPLLTPDADEGILGTADFVAPEQTRDSHAVDIRADLYSLGATGYFLLMGQPPFPDGTTPEKLECHRTRLPVPVKKLRPDAPDWLVEILNKLLAKDPADRYQTPADVVAALAPWVDLAPPMVPVTTPIISPTPDQDSTLGSGVWSVLADSPVAPPPVRTRTQPKAAPSRRTNARPPRRRPRWVLVVVALALVATIGVTFAAVSMQKKPTAAKKSTTAKKR